MKRGTRNLLKTSKAWLIVVYYGNIILVMDMPFTKSKKGITIKIKVEPRSSRKGISGVLGDTLKIRVNSPPVGGAANEELIEILSEEFGIRKTAIKIVRGNSSKEKVVEVAGIDSIPEIRLVK
jgi:uncharacterized protein (TIGR00251 family)